MTFLISVVVFPITIGYWYGRNQSAPYVDPDEYEWKG